MVLRSQELLSLGCDMTLHRLCAALAFALLTMSVGAPVAAASDAMALADCAGRPVVKPRVVVLTCADAGVSAGQLSWTGWGSTFAAGVGIASVNDCSPDCADGHFHKYRIVLIANGRERCSSGQMAYARVTYAWIGRSPYGQEAPGTTDPVVPYPCGNR
jgi:hypothetical protein